MFWSDLWRGIKEIKKKKCDDIEKGGDISRLGFSSGFGIRGFL